MSPSSDGEWLIVTWNTPLQLFEREGTGDRIAIVDGDGVLNSTFEAAVQTYKHGKSLPQGELGPESDLYAFATRAR